MKKILVLNGPNLNLLGQREPDVYGNSTLEDIEKYVKSELEQLKFSAKMDWFQSNSEGALIDKLHDTLKNPVDLIVINPGAYTHTSVALLDALKILTCRKVEVHISNTNTREDFRQQKVTSKSVDGVVEGFGIEGYLLAILSIFFKIS